MPATAPTIAVLDDEAEMRKALRRLLTCRGFMVYEFAGGEEFLDSLKSWAPECLLLDLHMPALNGFDVLEALRVRKNHLPVVVITAHDEPGTADRLRGFGVSAFLKKPVDRDVLLSAIETALSASPAHPT